MASERRFESSARTAGTVCPMRNDYGECIKVDSVGAEITAALPNDLHKLVWLCRLNPQ